MDPALRRGELPLLSQLAERGALDFNCLSIFPSVTPAATASIVTGRYPSGHGIAGMSWLNPSTQRISYFGDDVWTVLSRGIGAFVSGFLLHLNGDHLQAPTLFQLVERAGRRAACFNHIVFRGDVRHEVSQPLLLRLLPSVAARTTVEGPSWLCLGDFVASTPPGVHPEAHGGVFNRFGLDDEGTASFLRQVASATDLPDFSVAYFADYDFDSHQRGPHRAMATLRRLDERLSTILDAWGGLDRVLTELGIVLTADHSHSDVGEGESAGIPLEAILGAYACADPAAPPRNGDDLVLCPNMRAAEIYCRRDGPDFVEGVCATLLKEPRTDQVIWRQPETDADLFHVATADRGRLRFRRARHGSGAVRDDYGGAWHVCGELAAIDAAVEGGIVRYGVYPNALERIACGVDHPRSGRLWVTARPGCEFEATGQSVHHGAGSHGTLHENDSVVPLLVAGMDIHLPLGPRSRIVDVAPLCLHALDLESRFLPGESHV
jgi:hypothetical protein